MKEMYTYHCLGCNKEIKSSKIHPYGIICRECRTTTRLTVKCCDCGKLFKISWRTYESHGIIKPYRCRECNDKHQSERMIVFHATEPEDKKKDRLNKISIGVNKHIENESHEVRSERNKKQWERLSPEEIENKMKPARDGVYNKYKNETPDERKDRIELHRQIYNNKTPEEKAEHREISKQNRNKETYADFIRNEKQRAINCNAKSNEEKLYRLKETELAFKEILDSNDIEYKIFWYNMNPYPEFRYKFPINPYTNSIKVSPYHQWDFLIISEKKNIFVDIDGSMHDPKQASSDINYIRLFNDTQRSYQADYLQAFAVQCFDDEINDDNIVVSINSGNKMPLPKFIEYLKINFKRKGD